LLELGENFGKKRNGAKNTINFSPHCE